MDYQDQQQKGLFTFYKQQQAQEEHIRNSLRKKKKSKHKKSKKKIDEEKINIFKMEQGLIQSSSSHKLPEQFLKNVVGKYNKGNPSPKIEKEKQMRVKSEPCEEQDEKQSIANFIMEKKLDQTKIHEFGRFMFREKDRKIPIHKQISQVNEKINQLHTKIFNSQILSNPKGSEIFLIPKIQALKINEGVVSRSCKNEQKSFLDKIKHMQKGPIGGRSNLISNRDSLLKQREKFQFEEENKRYFRQLISNYNKKHNQSYKILNKSLKFPQIVKEERIIRMKTEQESPVMSDKKLLTPMKSFSSQKKNVKLNHQRYDDMYRIKMGALKQFNPPNDGKILNMIDMSKEYTEDVTQSEDRVIKKKLLKSRLGIEL